MKRMKIAVALFLAVSCFASYAPEAKSDDPLILECIADNTLMRNKKQANYGGWDYLSVHRDGEYAARRIILRFNIPSGVNLSSATLKLFITNNGDNLYGHGLDVKVYGIKDANNNWNEGTKKGGIELAGSCWLCYRWAYSSVNKIYWAGNSGLNNYLNRDHYTPAYSVVHIDENTGMDEDWLDNIVEFPFNEDGVQFLEDRAGGIAELLIVGTSPYVWNNVNFYSGDFLPNPPLYHEDTVPRLSIY